MILLHVNTLDRTVSSVPFIHLADGSMPDAKTRFPVYFCLLWSGDGGSCSNENAFKCTRIAVLLQRSNLYNSLNFCVWQLASILHEMESISTSDFVRFGVNSRYADWNQHYLLS